MSDDSKPEDSFEATQARHFAQCVKEGKFCLIAWILAWVFCAGIAFKFGYLPPDQRPDEPWLVLGMPGWVALGLFLPWLILICVTIWFALYHLKDDEPYQDWPEGAKAREEEDA